jgi:hypothetical protein
MMELLKNIPTIIREAGAGPLTFSAFLTLLLSVLGAYFFSGDDVWVRVFVFASIFIFVSVFALAVLSKLEGSWSIDRSQESLRKPEESRIGTTVDSSEASDDLGKETDKRTLHCSFCGKSQYEVKKLIAGPHVFICDECNDLTSEIVAESDALGREKEFPAICELTLAASDPNLTISDRQEKLLRAREIADRVKSVRRERSGDVRAGCVLKSIVGAGNFGTVWLAQKVPLGAASPEFRSIQDLDSGELAAVKKFDEDKLAIGLMLWRFLRGIRAMQHLSNVLLNPPKSIVRILNVDVPNLCFSMEYYPNGDLENIRNFGWSVRKRLEVFLQVCEAVNFAHRNHVVHRDIKPANVILDSSYGAALTDFDIADLRFARTQSIYSGSLGTPQFAAPEQLVGDNLIAYPSADIYSLGKLLYFVMSEVAPPLGSIEGERQHDYLTAVEHPSLRKAIMRAIQYNPMNRYSSVHAMLADMADALEEYEVCMPRSLLLTPSEHTKIADSSGGAES